MHSADRPPTMVAGSGLRLTKLVTPVTELRLAPPSRKTSSWLASEYELGNGGGINPSLDVFRSNAAGEPSADVTLFCPVLVLNPDRNGKYGSGLFATSA